MQFLEPTKKKIILALLVAIAWTVILTAQSFFSLTVTSLEPCWGIIGEPPPNPPLTFENIQKDLYSIIRTNDTVVCPPAEGSSLEVASNIYHGGQFILRLILSYIFLCIIVAIANKMKNQKKQPEAKVKR